MKIKKYTGQTEKDAILKVKNELGVEALIVSVKNIKPRGLRKLFKKPYVEVTAALDDKAITSVTNKEVETSKEPLDDSSFIEMLREFSKKSDEQVYNPSKKKEAEKQEKSFKKEEIEEDKCKVSEINSTDEALAEDLPILKVVYEQLLDNEICEEYINEIMYGFGELVKERDVDINDLVSIAYKRVSKIISDYEPITLKDNTSNVVVFVGPTGVGKTTTIAKIASHFSLNLNKKVALLTADTYRIAAVEQLRTYANILNIPIKPVYSSEELKMEIQALKDYDLILVDTAGRSPNNKEHHSELIDLLSAVDKKEIFLVLSLSTKYRDLLKITDLYNDILEYKIIFTKLDETTSYGNLFNIKMKTDAKLSYITFGQNVPDDISEIDIHDIAKKVLGGCE